MNDYQNFDKQAKRARLFAEELIIEHFGERCPDYDPHCLVCQRWDALADLLENPFDFDKDVDD